MLQSIPQPCRTALKFQEHNTTKDSSTITILFYIVIFQHSILRTQRKFRKFSKQHRISPVTLLNTQLRNITTVRSLRTSPTVTTKLYFAKLQKCFQTETSTFLEVYQYFSKSSLALSAVPDTPPALVNSHRSAAANKRITQVRVIR